MTNSENKIVLKVLYWQMKFAGNIAVKVVSLMKY